MQKSRKTKEQANAFVPLFGFIVLVILAVIAFLLSSTVETWLTTASLTVGTFNVLPMSFPAEWPPIASQLVVTFVIWLIFFVLAMIAMLPFMGSSNPDQEFSKEARDYIREKDKQSRRRR